MLELEDVFVGVPGAEGALRREGRGESRDREPG